jgi:SAM-dependent methyltransferase
LAPRSVVAHAILRPVQSRTAPVPPPHLAARVGSVEGADPLEFYLREGAAVRERIERYLPPAWGFQGKRVLDFGCGPARVLRHFLDEARHAELWGCDIDAESIDWVQRHLSPPLRCFRNDPLPPLPIEEGYFDLVWATSVFTHIDRWSDWLLEMHRVLAEDGLLIASFLGEGMWEALLGERYREDEVGMTVLRHWETGDRGPDVLHSEWWLREHWGRAFDVLEVERPTRAADGSAEVTHSYISLRRRTIHVTKAELERRDPREPRELAGLETNVRLLRREIDALVASRSLGSMAAESLRDAVLRSPLRGPARRIRRMLRAI